MEKALKEAEARMIAITQTAQDAIIMIDPKGDVSFWNPAAEKMFGYTVEDVLGCNVHNLIAPKRFHPSYKAKFPHFQKTGEGGAIGKTIELVGKHKDGREIQIELSLSSIKLEDGWHAAGIIRDITDRKRVEKELIYSKEEAEKASKAKSEFLATISHELRTPMNAILGFTELLNQTDLTDSQKKFIENVHFSGKALLEIINDMLDFSEIERGKLELRKNKEDIIKILEDGVSLVKPCADKKGLNLYLSIKQDIPKYALTDSIRLKQVIINLLSNAIKFTKEGEIEVKVEFISIGESRGKYNFSVRDTGIGIKEEDKEKIFKAFSQVDSSNTRKYGGIGLGLVISNSLVEKMGGQMKLESTPGKGSVFSFSIVTEYIKEI